MGTMKMTSEEFVSAASKNYGLAVVPMRAAAKRLGVSRSRIDQLVASDKLDAVKIQDDDEPPLRGITIESLDEFVSKQESKEKHHDQLVSKARKLLESRLRKAVEPVEYGELMPELDMEVQNPSHRNLIGWILGVVSRQTYQETHVDDDTGVMLSALVVRKQSQLPSEPFFQLLVELKQENDPSFSLPPPDTPKGVQARKVEWERQMVLIRAWRKSLRKQS